MTRSQNLLAKKKLRNGQMTPKKTRSSSSEMGTSPSPVLWHASFNTAGRLLPLLWMSLVRVIEVTHKSIGPFLRWEIASLAVGVGQAKIEKNGSTSTIIQINNMSPSLFQQPEIFTISSS
ncbi:hypothetical protein E3N88_42525 [Mikania micrantha]|uniref:Uncharacterized protein n=1 Tax=Mikania micrantha TaxID=192012 RepID=A0A5N6LHL0_9ASTR|nr:hypothetical protein E3N88_42525 [Mikania micrantha]